MPSPLDRVCAFPFCGAITTERYCPAHKIEKPFEKSTARVEGEHRRVYNARWRRLRRVVLHEEPECRMCASRGLVRAAEVVDHIIPVSLGGDPYDRDNLQPLCKRCHDSAKQAEDAEARKTAEPKSRRAKALAYIGIDI